MTKLYFVQNNGVVDVKLQTDIPVNAWSGQLIFGSTPKNLKILTSNSITQIWQQLPNLENDRVVFTGGTPNGFSGEGLLFHLVLAPGDYSLRFSPETAVYLNDGLGSRASTTLSTLNFKVGEATTVVLPSDTLSPQPFTPTIYQDKNFFDGKPVVIFSTQDLESGLNHYEVKEILSNGVLDWHIAQSPYLVNSGVKQIQIKAVDNFGNERIETVNVGPRFIGWPLIIIILVIIGFALVYNKRKWRKRNS